MNILITDAWRLAYPEASLGILLLDGVANPPENAALNVHVRQVEDELRSQWAGLSRAELNQLPEFAAYRNYYRRFEKTYHVQLQFESVVLKGKPLRSNGSLVLAMFAAELHNRLLTAGHDLALIQSDVVLATAAGGERYVGIGGQELLLQSGDMYMYDAAGIISSVLYGPDQRTRITADTRQAIFCVYAPPGIHPAAVEQHLTAIARNVRLVAPQASAIQQRIYTAS